MILTLFLGDEALERYKRMFAGTRRTRTRDDEGEGDHKQRKRAKVDV